MSDYRILLVDDEPFVLTATASLLSAAGYSVQSCEQWTGVAAAVFEGRPHLVLLDYNMPGIKGDELCSILKRNAAHSEMRIIIFSSEDESTMFEVVRRAGADGYLRKDVAGRVLLEKIEGLLAKTHVA